MDTLNPGSSALPDLAELRAQQRHLQSLFITTLAALILFCVCVAAFIFKQTRLVQQNLAEQRPAVQRLSADYQRTSEPLIRDFSRALAQFAATNEDFRPILEKYQPVLSNYMVAPLPVVRPAAAPSN